MLAEHALLPHQLADNLRALVEELLRAQESSSANLTEQVYAHIRAVSVIFAAPPRSQHGSPDTDSTDGWIGNVTSRGLVATLCSHNGHSSLLTSLCDVVESSEQHGDLRLLSLAMAVLRCLAMWCVRQLGGRLVARDGLGC